MALWKTHSVIGTKTSGPSRAKPNWLSQYDHPTTLHALLVSLNDDQIRARTQAAAHNLAALKHITLNLIRLDSVKRKGGIKARRLIAAISDLIPPPAPRAPMTFMRLPR